MIPIFEQGSGSGIGHSADSFIRRFHEIAFHNINSGGAKALAFVFYDFQDQDFKRILKDQGVFTKLDRLSGNDLNIFYLHSGSNKLLKDFNQIIMTNLGVNEQAITPCIVFFKTSPDRFTDISVVRLDSTNLIHGFHELYSVIETYISGSKIKHEYKYITWVKGSLKFVALESIKIFISELMKSKIF